MQKNKNKNYLFYAIVIFFSIIFVGISKVSAEEDVPPVTPMDDFNSGYGSTYNSASDVDMYNGVSSPAVYDNEGSTSNYSTYYGGDDEGTYYKDYAGCVSYFGASSSSSCLGLPGSPTDENGNDVKYTDYDGCVAYFRGMGTSDPYSSCGNLPGDPAANKPGCDRNPSCIIYNCCPKSTSTNTATVGGQKGTFGGGGYYTAPGASISYQNPTVGFNPGGLSLSANGMLGTVYDQGAYGGAYSTYAGNYAGVGGLPGASSSANGGATLESCYQGCLSQPAGDDRSDCEAGCRMKNSAALSSVYGLTGLNCGVGFTSVGGVCFPANTGLSSAPIQSILANIFSWLMILFTTFAIIAFVVSGIQYFVAAGSSDMMEVAKRNAMYALIGIVVGLSGFVIIKAIAAALSGGSYFF